MTKRILCALLALLLAFGCAACGQAEAEPTTEATTEPTTVPTTEATEPPTTEPPTEAPTEPPLVLHSGLREDGTFSEGTLFIGDSLTCGFISSFLSSKGHLGHAKYMTICGSKVTAFFDGTILEPKSNVVTLYSPEFEGKTFDVATADLGEDAEAIYLMWGTNYVPKGTEQDYIDIIDYLLEHCPNATIHLQLVPYADLGIIPYPTINQRIRDAYAHYAELEEPRVFMVDTYMGIGRDVGVDGVHIGMYGYNNWYKTLLKHAETNQLSE